MKEHSRIPKITETIEKYVKSAQSNYPILTLGEGEESVFIREEEREHIHIIGTTGEGKSKLLERLIRHDIDNGRGVCFLDPSDRGDTMYNVLRYCYEVGHKKVCLIDPHHHSLFNKIPVINPFHFSYRNASVSNVMDAVKTVFGQKDSADTPRINRYLPAILRILWSAKATLRDSIYFTEKAYVSQREQLYENLDVYDRDMMTIEGAYRTQFTMQNFLSTVNRLEPFYNSTLELIFGGLGGINFAKMIAEKWVILVNLYSGFGFDPLHTRLLGTSVIHELIFAMDRLIERNKRYGKKYEVPYHLYIDEAGRYANQNLAEILSYKRKSNFKVTISHQYFSQFKDEDVLDAINQLCKLKIAFYIPDPEDRVRFVKMAYGGELADRDVSHVLSGQKKQYAVIKKPKRAAHIVRILDVDPVDVTQEQLDQYIKQIYENEWYKTPKQISDSFNERFPKKNPNGSQSGAPPNGSAASKASVPRGVRRRRGEDIPASDEKPQNAGKSGPIKI